MSVPDWVSLGNVSNIASLVSTGLTIWTLWTVRRIEKHYRTQARLPEVLKAVEEHKRFLSRHVGSATSQPNPFRGAVVAYRETLLAAKRIANGDARTAVQREIANVDVWLDGQDNTQDRAWDIVNGAQAAKTALGHMQRDSQWGTR